MTPRPPNFWREARARFRLHWPLKTVGTTAAMTVFFVAYFWVLNHPAYPVTAMPPTALDAAIPFQPLALAPYASLWLYVSLAPGLLATRRALAGYAAAATALAVSGLTIFYFWPTAAPAVELDLAATPALAFLKQVDATGNACPSLHVAFAIFTALRLRASLAELGASRRWHAGNALWAALITYSTLATKQHVAIDAFAGAALGALVAWGYAALGNTRRNCAASGNTAA